MVRYASPFAKSRVCLYTVSVFVTIWVRYVIRCLNLRTKRTKSTVRIGTARFMGKLWPSIKIRATVHEQLKIHDIAQIGKPVFMSRLYLI